MSQGNKCENKHQKDKGIGAEKWKVLTLNFLTPDFKTEKKNLVC